MHLFCCARSNEQQNIKGIKDVSNRNRTYKNNETVYYICILCNIIIVINVLINNIIVCFTLLFLYNFETIMNGYENK